MQPVRPAKEVSSTRKDAYRKDSMNLHNFFALITELSLLQNHLTHLNKMINMTWSENANIAQVHHTTKMV